MKFPIVEPSPLPILIPLGSKYQSQDSVFLRSSLIYIYTDLRVESQKTRACLTIKALSSLPCALLFQIHFPFFQILIILSLDFFLGLAIRIILPGYPQKSQSPTIDLPNYMWFLEQTIHLSMILIYTYYFYCSTVLKFRLVNL